MPEKALQEDVTVTDVDMMEEKPTLSPYCIDFEALKTREDIFLDTTMID